MLFNFHKGKCQKYQLMLSPYIDGRVTPAEKQALESHLASCQECCKELESLRATVGLLHRVPMETVPRSFTVVEARPMPAPKVLAPMRWATAIAVVALALFLAGDLLHVYPEKDSSNSKTSIVTVQTDSTPAQISGNRIGGSLDVTVVPTPPDNVVDVPPVTAAPLVDGAQPIAPFTQTPASNGMVGDRVVANQVDKDYRWPVHQIEFALLGLAAVMLATTIVIWRRGERVSVKDEDEK